MANLLGVVAFRTTAWFGLLVFVPLWEVSLGHSKAAGGRLLALMLLSGGVGTLVLGPLADRYGRRLVLRCSIAAMPPLILVFIAVGGVPGAVALALVGACTVGTFGVTIVLAQEYLPRQIGLASGLSVGFAIGLGGDRRRRAGRDRRLGRAPDFPLRLRAGARAGDLPCPAAPARPCGRLDQDSDRGGDMAASVSEFFDGLEAGADPDKLAGVDTTYLFEIDGAGEWLVAIHDGHMHVSEGSGEADCVISASADTFLKIANGEQNATSAYMTGKIKIKGDMGAAMKLQTIF